MTLGEAGETIELIERCRRIIGPALPASLMSQNIRIQFVTPEDGASADVTAERDERWRVERIRAGPPRLKGAGL
jgi:hypothetical protein